MEGQAWSSYIYNRPATGAVNIQRTVPLYARPLPITGIYYLNYFYEHHFCYNRHSWLLFACRRLQWTKSRPSAFPVRLPPDNLLQAASAVVYMTDCPPTTNEKE